MTVGGRGADDRATEQKATLREPGDCESVERTKRAETQADGQAR